MGTVLNWRSNRVECEAVAATKLGDDVLDDDDCDGGDATAVVKESLMRS